MGIRILGTCSFVPEKTVENEEFTKYVETSDEWIVKHSGISRRHIHDGANFEMAVKAGERALENAGLSPEDLDLILCTTVSSDYYTPSLACVVQGKLGAVNALAFDINAACAAFVYALDMANMYLQHGYHHILIVSAEGLSKITDYTDRSTCVLFGDGAGAVVVEWREDYPSIHAVLGCHGDPEMLGVTGAEKAEPARIFMHGQPTFKFAVKAVPYCIDQVLEKAGMAIEDVDFFVFHQANARIIDLAAKKYHIPPEKYYKNIQKYGNTSAASIPLVISELHDLGKVGPGSRVLVVGFGGGLTWGGALVEFA